MTFNDYIWWIGAGVIGAVGLLGAGLIMAGAATASALLATHNVKKFGNVARNMRDMHAWVSNGRPQWKKGEHDNVYRLVPFDGPYEDPYEEDHA